MSSSVIPSGASAVSAVSDFERQRMRQPPRELPLLRQRWSRLAFLHWAVDPMALASRLPPGLRLDVWDGRAYVGVVPFRIDRARASFLPAIPGFSRFDELNLRTYVHHEGRDPGVFFFSLDASSLSAVWGARALYKLPYFPAAITVVPDGPLRTSFVCRRPPDGPHFACTYEASAAVDEARVGTLEFFLAERYLLYSWDGARLRSARVWHRPYPLTKATLRDLDENLLATLGLGISAYDEPLVHHAAEVDVRLYAPRQIRARVPPTPLRARVNEYRIAPTLAAQGGDPT